MTDKIEVDRARYEGLEKLMPVVAMYHEHHSADTTCPVCKVLRAIPPKPEELLEVEGWSGEFWAISGNTGYSRWAKGNDIVFVGPNRPTKAEAIREGNAAAIAFAEAVIRGRG